MIHAQRSANGCHTNVTSTTPRTFESVFASAARIALREAPMQAISAVNVVPMFEPRTSATAVGKSTTPAPARPMTSTTTAAEEWMSAVTTALTSAALRKPAVDVAAKNESALRTDSISRIGSKPSARSCSPKKSVPSPMNAMPK